MGEVEFNVPIHFEDVSLPSNDRYCVDSLLEHVSIKDIQCVHQQLTLQPLDILEHSCFDTLYSAVIAWSQVDDSVRAHVPVILEELLEVIVQSLDEFRESPEELGRSRGAIKMVCFLMSGVLSRANKQLTLLKKSEDSIRCRSLRVILDSMTHPNIKVLWRSPSGASLKDQLGETLLKTFSSFFDSHFLLRKNDVKNIVFSLFTLIVVDFERPVEMSNFIIQSVLKLDYASAGECFAESIFHIRSSYEQNAVSLVGIIIREIGKLNTADISKDSSASKGLSGFMVALACTCPELVLSNISILMPHLDVDNYVLRNSIIQVIGKLLVFLQKEAVSVENDHSRSTPVQTQKSLLNLLEGRILDTSSYCRSKLLQVWIDMAENGAIPSDHWNTVSGIAVDRLSDKTLQVRKNALQLLTTLLENNPFGPVLSSEPLASKLIELQGTKDSSIDAEVTNSLNNQIQFLGLGISFLGELSRGMSVLLSQLGNANTPMVLQIVKFIMVGNHFCLDSFEKGLFSLLPLVVLSEKNGTPEIKDAIVDAFWVLYFNPEGQTPRRIALKLVKLVTSVSDLEKECLANLVIDIVREHDVPRTVIVALWESFSSASVHIEEHCAHLLVAGALDVISMIGSAQPLVIECNLKCILDTVFPVESPEKVHGRVIDSACNAFMKVAISNSELDDRDAIIEKLFLVCCGKVGNGPMWFSAAEKAMNVLFRLHDSPSKLVASLIQSWYDICGRIDVLSTDDNPALSVEPPVLSQFLFVLGHMAIKMLFAVESTESSLNKLRNKVKTVLKEEANGIDPDIDAGCDDYELELLKEQAESSIVSPGSLIGVFGPVVVHICSNPDVFSDIGLQASAAVALCKFVCVGSDFCEDNLQLLFTILEHSKQPYVRSTIIITLGDLATRFPNLVDPWTGHLFRKLHDSDVHVRNCSLMIISFLVLNDMIKVKYDLCELLRCTEDGDKDICQLANSFFLELSRKGNNQIYNLIPPTLAKMLSDNLLSSEKFKSYSRFLFKFLSKEKHIEGIVDKLCQRISTVADSATATSLMYCISLLDLSAEKSTTKFISNFKHYKKWIGAEDMYCEVISILNKIQKTCKPELKDRVQNLENDIERYMRSEGEVDIPDSDLSTMPLIANKPKARSRRSARDKVPDLYNSSEAGSEQLLLSEDD